MPRTVESGALRLSRFPLLLHARDSIRPARSEVLEDVAVAKEHTTIEVAGHEVRLSSPSKVFFPKPKFTKLDLAEYYIAVADAAVNQLRERPGTMKRFVDGAAGEFFFQKRVPKNAPDWLQTATFTFPSGRTATELVANDARAPGLGGQPRRHRLQPPPRPPRRPGLPRRAARRPRPAARRALEHGPAGRDVRQGGARGPRPGRLPEDLGLARDPRQRPHQAASGTTSRSAARPSPWPARSSGACPRRPPASGGRRSATASSSTTTRTRATARSPSGYSVRPVPDAKVCCPITWKEVPDVEPGDLRLDTVPARLKRRRDPAADIDKNAGLARQAPRPRPPRRGGGPRRRPLAAALPQAARRAEARAAEQGEEAGGAKKR